MTKQLILNGILLPESSKDRFSCWVETRGKIWKASYSFDYMGNEKLRQVLAVLRSGGPFLASVLPDNSDEMVSSYFLLDSITQPTFAFSKGGVGLWHNLAFTLREVEPHD